MYPECNGTEEYSRLPIYMYINCRLPGINKLLVTKTKLTLKLHIGIIYIPEWIMNIKQILIECDMNKDHIQL